MPTAFAGKVSEWPVPTPEFARDPEDAKGQLWYVGSHNGRLGVVE
jgi:hypothetical protein